MDTQVRPRTRTAPRRPAPQPATPAAEAAPAPAQATRPRTRTRTAPAARPQGNPIAVAIPEPFNPYVLPTDRSPQGWARWAMQAIILSLIATLIWDRGTMIRPETKGRVTPLAAPAQWVSAAILCLGSFALIGALGVPWGGIPLAVGFVVLTRRSMAVEGVALTLQAATDRLIRKLVLAGLGVGAWWSSIVLSAWVSAVTAGLTNNPLSMLAGATAVSDMKEQTASIAAAILRVGTGTSGILLFIAVLWWSRAAYLTGMDTADEQLRAAEKLRAEEEPVNV